MLEISSIVRIISAADGIVEIWVMSSPDLKNELKQCQNFQFIHNNKETRRRQGKRKPKMSKMLKLQYTRYLHSKTIQQSILITAKSYMGMPANC